MNQVRARVDSIVKDPETAEKLKPYYRQFCKRPGFHDEYLATYNLPNVQRFGRSKARATIDSRIFCKCYYLPAV